MNKLVEITEQFHVGRLDYAQYKLRFAAALSELTEGDCAELAMAIEGWNMAKDLN